MNYIPISEHDREVMLDAVGVKAPTDLFVDVPNEALIEGTLDLGKGLSEFEVSELLKELALKNIPASDIVSFAGAGIYDHYIPSFVDHIISKPEFFTAYTPYQPEVSQGTLQAVYEYQTDICNLTGLELSNASMYDGATALVEAVFMAHRLGKKRNRVIIAGGIHPQFIETLNTYSRPMDIDLVYVNAHDGVDDFESMASLVDGDTCAVVVGYPNYYGSVADFRPLAQSAHEAGALVIAVANPLLLSVLEAPALLGADVCVGEAQVFGNAMAFGGPGLGYFACTKKCMRQMPGRIVGATVDEDGNRGYVLTLSTREQHIRREKATSNICSNHALNALAAGAYLAGMGKEGLKEVALTCISKAHYFCDALVGTGKFEKLNNERYGYEFTLAFKGDRDAFYEYCIERNIVPGIKEGSSHLIFAVTEKTSRAQLDAFVKEVALYE